MTIKNRGALSNPVGRFEIHDYEAYDDGWHLTEEEAPLAPLATVLYPEQTKSIITHNASPDISFDQSINPYRGCEHGCIYCYARPAHAYINLSPGIDFETKIFHKVDAAKRLEEEINKPKYECKVIVIGANTDPYQPAEAKLKITQSLLEVLNRYHHPVAIITKSGMIERDLDILEAMAKRQLISVAISLTTLRMDLKRILEPRASSPQARLRAIEKLNGVNVPVTVMAAPMIPMINDAEIEKILALAAKRGAKFAGFTLIRLPHEVKILFKEWLAAHFPDRAEHVMSIIKQMRGGKEYDATFGKRMRGEGQFAILLAKRFALACKRFHLNEQPRMPLDTSQFKPRRKEEAQMSLW
ncbi:MAG: PA0069 family radical SAM protein [Gammaproteobacteria bacterium]|nr:PA0069 family radical SAM protein [Gammaproteobacteria bacterium]